MLSLGKTGRLITTSGPSIEKALKVTRGPVIIIAASVAAISALGILAVRANREMTITGTSLTALAAEKAGLSLKQVFGAENLPTPERPGVSPLTGEDSESLRNIGNLVNPAILTEQPVRAQMVTDRLTSIMRSMKNPENGYFENSDGKSFRVISTLHTSIRFMLDPDKEGRLIDTVSSYYDSPNGGLRPATEDKFIATLALDAQMNAIRKKIIEPITSGVVRETLGPVDTRPVTALMSNLDSTPGLRLIGSETLLPGNSIYGASINKENKILMVDDPGAARVLSAQITVRDAQEAVGSREKESREAQRAVDQATGELATAEQELATAKNAADTAENAADTAEQEFKSASAEARPAALTKRNDAIDERQRAQRTLREKDIVKSVKEATKRALQGTKTKVEAELATAQGALTAAKAAAAQARSKAFKIIRNITEGLITFVHSAKCYGQAKADNNEIETGQSISDAEIREHRAYCCGMDPYALAVPVDPTFASDPFFGGDPNGFNFDSDDPVASTIANSGVYFSLIGGTMVLAEKYLPIFSKYATRIIGKGVAVRIPGGVAITCFAFNGTYAGIIPLTIALNIVRNNRPPGKVIRVG